MTEYKNTFVEFVREQYKNIKVCTWAHIRHHGLFGNKMDFDCAIVGDRVVFSDKHGENPCSIEDFKNCPLFPFQNKERK
jgi:hypothetical protein